MLRKLYLLPALLLISFAAISQTTLTIPPNGGNKKASVSERIGITDVTIHYDRPAVKGREGKIWNDLVHAGYKDLGFGTSKQAPWRAGANENTTITFSTDVMVEGKPVKAGTYGLFLAYDDSNPTLILSNNTQSWGSFFYDPKEDALRVNLKPMKLNESVERLKYEFFNQTDNSATVALMWEKMSFPFKVDVDLVKIQLAVYRDELRGDKGFIWQNFVQAADYAMQNNDMEDAMKWSDIAMNSGFPGVKNFNTLSTRANILNKSGKATEADALMKQAIPMATMQELHQYGRQLLREKKTAQALQVFKMNNDKYPNEFTTNMGLARGYSASGDFKSALKYAKIAETLSPASNKEMVGKLIKTLEGGKDIN